MGQPTNNGAETSAEATIVDLKSQLEKALLDLQRVTTDRDRLQQSAEATRTQEKIADPKAQLEKALLDLQRVTADRDRLQALLTQASNSWRVISRTLG